MVKGCLLVVMSEFLSCGVRPLRHGFKTFKAKIFEVTDLDYSCVQLWSLTWFSFFFLMMPKGGKC